MNPPRAAGLTDEYLVGDEVPRLDQMKDCLLRAAEPIGHVADVDRLLDRERKKVGIAAAATQVCRADAAR